MLGILLKCFWALDFDGLTLVEMWSVFSITPIFDPKMDFFGKIDLRKFEIVVYSGLRSKNCLGGTKLPSTLTSSEKFGLVY